MYMYVPIEKITVALYKRPKGERIIGEIGKRERN